MALVAPDPHVALLDGRYQLIRQLSGPPRAPLMVASDLQTGRVVCIRLQRFSVSMASLAAVPLLAHRSRLPGDGPLLPYDFGVDEGTAYLVRDFVTGTSLEQRLAEPEGPTPAEIVSILRRAGEALIEAAEQGFQHPGLALRHLLVGQDGTVRVSGYDGGQSGQVRTSVHDGAMLAAVLPLAFAGTPLADLPPAVRTLLTRCKTWQVTAVPNLEAVVRHVRRCEEQLTGYSRLGEGVTKTAHATAAIAGRFRRLGPLLHPYLVVLALVVAVVILAARALASPIDPGRLVVYPIPTRAPTDPATTYPFANPPHVVVTTTRAEASTTTATSAVARTADAAPSAPERTADSRVAPPVTRNETDETGQTLASVPETRRIVPPPTTRRETAAAPVQRADVRESPRAAPTARTTAPSVEATTANVTAPVDARSTVVVTSLTAQATTARVTIIAATSTGGNVSPSTVRSTSSASTSAATSAAMRTGEQTRSSATTAKLGTAGTVAETNSVSRTVATGH